MVSLEVGCRWLDRTSKPSKSMCPATASASSWFIFASFAGDTFLSTPTAKAISL